MSARVARNHKILVSVTFDKPCSIRHAGNEFRDAVHGKFYCTPRENSEPTTFKIRAAGALKLSARKASMKQFPDLAQRMDEFKKVASVIAEGADMIAKDSGNRAAWRTIGQYVKLAEAMYRETEELRLKPRP